VHLGHDWPAYFEAVVRGREAQLERRRGTFRVVDHHQTGGDRLRFAREVVWYARSAANLPYRMDRVTDNTLVAELSAAPGT
jgi:hypothetical protein